MTEIVSEDEKHLLESYRRLSEQKKQALLSLLSDK